MTERSPETTPEIPQWRRNPALFYDLWVNQAKAHLVMLGPDQPTKYFTEHEPLGIEDIRDHLDGKKTVGSMNISQAGDCKWTCFDLDARDTVKEDVKRILDTLAGRYGIEPLVEESSPGSYHVWVFWRGFAAPEEAREFGLAVLRTAGVQAEVFPKQVDVGAEPRNVGNGVKLPGFHRKKGVWSILDLALDKIKTYPPPAIEKKAEAKLAPKAKKWDREPRDLLHLSCIQKLLTTKLEPGQDRHTKLLPTLVSAALRTYPDDQGQRIAEFYEPFGKTQGPDDTRPDGARRWVRESITWEKAVDTGTLPHIAKVNMEEFGLCDPACEFCRTGVCSKDCETCSPKRDERRSQADHLVEITLEETRLYHSDRGEPFAVVPIETHSEMWPIESKQFTAWLARRFWQTKSRTPNTESVRSARNVIIGYAQNEGAEIRMSVRVAGVAGSILYDLCDPGWHVVSIEPGCWQVMRFDDILTHNIVEKTASSPPHPPLTPGPAVAFDDIDDICSYLGVGANVRGFRRYSHMKEAEIPHSNNIENIVNIVNIVNPARLAESRRIVLSWLEMLNLKAPDKTIPGPRLLFLTAAIACFIPGIVHPIIIIYGPKGSSKTTIHKLIRALIDPSVMLTLDMPYDRNELIRRLAHNRIAFFDNVSYLPQFISDILCRAATGEGSDKRALYTDEDDIVFTYRRCLGLNGINISARAPDLLDRCVILETEKITKESRLTERDLWNKWGEFAPRLRAAVFDILAEALRIYPTIKLPTHERLADFQDWGCAISLALGFSEQDFLTALSQNVSSRDEEVVFSNDISRCLVAWMDQAAADWQGTPANLLAGLTNTAEALGIDTRMKTWPKSPQVLTRRLNLLLDNLADYGITLQAERSVTRTLTIKDSRPATLDRRDKPIRDIIRAELRKIQPAHKTSLQDFKDDLMSRKEVSSQDVDKAFAFFKKNGDLAEPDPGVFYVVPGHDLDATGGRLA